MCAYEILDSSSAVNTGLSVAGGTSDMFQYFSTILCVHFSNSREGKSISGVGNPCAPNKSMLILWMYIHTINLSQTKRKYPSRPPNVCGVTRLVLPDFLAQNEWQLQQKQHLYLLACDLRQVNQYNLPYLEVQHTPTCEGKVHAQAPGEPWQEIGPAHIREQANKGLRHGKQCVLCGHSEWTMHWQPYTLQRRSV